MWPWWYIRCSDVHPENACPCCRRQHGLLPKHVPIGSHSGRTDSFSLHSSWTHIPCMVIQIPDAPLRPHRAAWRRFPLHGSQAHFAPSTRPTFFWPWTDTLAFGSYLDCPPRTVIPIPPVCECHFSLHRFEFFIKSCYTMPAWHHFSLPTTNKGYSSSH